VAQTTTFTITAQITCPVASGNKVFLVAEITNADGHGHTEYWLIEKWVIDVNTTAAQSFQSTVTSGVTRTYFLISTTQANLDSIKNQAGNLQSNGGYFSIGGLQPVSNTQTTKQMS
jgi:hypothetical protein